MDFFAGFTTGAIGAVSSVFIMIFFQTITTIRGNNHSTDAEMLCQFIIPMILGGIIDFFTPPEYKYMYVLLVIVVYVPAFIYLVTEIVVSIITSIKRIIQAMW